MAKPGSRDDESLRDGQARLEEVLDDAFVGWREAEQWRRSALVQDSTGAVDLPGTSWTTRPSVDQGHGYFLAGDAVAAPGMLSEVSFASASQAGGLAARCAAGAFRRRPSSCRRPRSGLADPSPLSAPLRSSARRSAVE